MSTQGALPGAVIPPYRVMPVGAHAVVAGGGHDDDASLHRVQRGNREGIGLVRFVHRRRDGQVDDANVQRVAILDGVFDGRNHVADAAGAGAVERLQDNQPCRGSNARALPVGVVAVAGDDAGDVRAVTVIVVGRRLAAHEIDESIDALRPLASARSSW